MKELSAETVKEIRDLAAGCSGAPEKLMEVLLKIQTLTDNCISKETLKIVSAASGFTLTELYAYRSFYARFSDVPRGKYIIRMCKSAPCHICGAKEIVATICDELGIGVGETTADGQFTLEYCECIGLCESSPSIMINDKPFSDLTPDKVKEILSMYRKEVDL